MDVFERLTPQEISQEARALFAEERTRKVLNGWFRTREIADAAGQDESFPELRVAAQLEAIVEGLPLDISSHAIFAGTQRDAFAASYALINPAFQVETFRGYCDPLEVYGAYSEYTDEVAFFIEQVTGHVIPDFRVILRDGVDAVCRRGEEKLTAGGLSEKHAKNLTAMVRSLRCAVTLAERYAQLAEETLREGKGGPALELMAHTLRRVPRQGAATLYEALQSFLILWQVMCLEQAPNPFAFSVGNADRIFAPYMERDGLSRQQAAALFQHFQCGRAELGHLPECAHRRPGLRRK